VAVLNTALGWVNGDVERILIAVGVWIGPYTLHEATVCCNQLGLTSPTMVNRVRTLVTQYEAACTAQREANVGANAGRVLRKADVLEWDTENGGTAHEGATRERARCQEELVQIFGACPILSVKGTDAVTALYRS